MKKLVLIIIVAAIYAGVFIGAWSPWCKPVRPVPIEAVDNAAPLFFTSTLINPDSAEPMSHVSSVAALADGRAVAVWYSGSKELARDVRIFISTYDPAAGAWSTPAVAATREETSADLGRYVRKVGNPVVFTTGGDKLWLVYVAMPMPGWSGSSLAYKVSHDDGRTWSRAGRLYLSPLANMSKLVKNKPAELDGGRLLLPVYQELGDTYPEVLLLRPEGDRLRYAISRMLDTEGLLQPSIMPTQNSDGNADGSAEFAAFFRNAHGEEQEYVMRSVSKYDGRCWQDATETSVPNPNSGLDVVSAGDKRAVMVANDTYSDRTRLAVYTSTDDGQSWARRKVLENTPEMEFSYPSIVRTNDGVYHVTYTYDRKAIKHVTFSDAWLWEAP